MGDVRVVECSECLGFAGESRQSIGIGGEGVRQNLQRDIAIELRIARAIHLTHASFTDRRGDLIDAEAPTGCEGQTLVVDYTGGAAARTGFLLSGVGRPPAMTS